MVETHKIARVLAVRGAKGDGSNSDQRMPTTCERVRRERVTFFLAGNEVKIPLFGRMKKTGELNDDDKYTNQVCPPALPLYGTSWGQILRSNL